MNPISSSQPLHSQVQESQDQDELNFDFAEPQSSVSASDNTVNTQEKEKKKKKSKQSNALDSIDSQANDPNKVGITTQQFQSFVEHVEKYKGNLLSGGPTVAIGKVLGLQGKTSKACWEELKGANNKEWVKKLKNLKIEGDFFVAKQTNEAEEQEIDIPYQLAISNEAEEILRDLPVDLVARLSPANKSSMDLLVSLKKHCLPPSLDESEFQSLKQNLKEEKEKNEKLTKEIQILKENKKKRELQEQSILDNKEYLAESSELLIEFVNKIKDLEKTSAEKLHNCLKKRKSKGVIVKNDNQSIEFRKFIFSTECCEKEIIIKEEKNKITKKTFNSNDVYSAIFSRNTFNLERFVKYFYKSVLEFIPLREYSPHGFGNMKKWPQHFESFLVDTATEMMTKRSPEDLKKEILQIAKIWRENQISNNSATKTKQKAEKRKIQIEKSTEDSLVQESDEDEPNEPDCKKRRLSILNSEVEEGKIQYKQTESPSEKPPQPEERSRTSEEVKKHEKKSETSEEKSPQPEERSRTSEEMKKHEKKPEKQTEKEKMEIYVQKIEFSLSEMGFNQETVGCVGRRFRKTIDSEADMWLGGALFTLDIVESFFRNGFFDESFYSKALFSQVAGELEVTNVMGGTGTTNFWIENREESWELHGFKNGEKIVKKPKNDCIFKKSVIFSILELVSLVEGNDLDWEAINTLTGRKMISAALLFAFSERDSAKGFVYYTKRGVRMAGEKKEEKSK